MIRRQILLALAAGAIGLAGGQASAQTETPRPGGTLRFVMKYEPPTLSSINNTSTPLTSGKIFDGLVTYDFDLNPKPQLATSWTISPDGLKYVFKLRAGVTWHDGKPFTSADAAFSILRLKAGHPRGRATFANVDKAETPDPLTLELTLSKPAPFLIVALGPSESPIVPKHLFEGVDIATPPGPPLLIGTGPFILKEWTRGSHAVLERNPNYWDKPKPYLDRVVIRFMPDAAARAAAFEAGDVDLGSSAPVPLADLPRFERDPRFAIFRQDYAYTGQQHQIFFNLETDVLKDRRVREAIAHALDLQRIVDVVFYGAAKVSPSPVSVALTPFHDPTVKPRAFDPARSERLLDEAGLAKKADSMRVQLRLLINPFIDSRLADFVRQSLRRVGVDAVIQPREFAAYVKQVYTDRQFDMIIESLSNVFDPTVGIQRGYWSKNFRPGLPFSNSARYESAEADRLLEAAAIENDIEKRKALFREFQHLVNRDIPSIDLLSPLEVVIASRRLRNFAVGAEGVSSNWADAFFVAQ
ncbi:MAG: ABC transporter substrate-binding protein [Alphaproteobacteria bacterium]|nr:ABC transporter substrate-binding protein [Alphaproteobacteria bacterium]